MSTLVLGKFSTIKAMSLAIENEMKNSNNYNRNAE